MYVCKYVDQNELGCHAGHQEVSNCHTRGKKPRVEITRSPNSGINGSTKRADVPQKNYLKIECFCRSVYTAGIVLIVISGICIVVGIILIILVCVIGANSKTTPVVSTSLIIQRKTLNFLCDESNKSVCFPCRAIWIASLRLCPTSLANSVL